MAVVHLGLGTACCDRVFLVSEDDRRPILAGPLAPACMPTGGFRSCAG